MSFRPDHERAVLSAERFDTWRVSLFDGFLDLMERLRLLNREQWWRPMPLWVRPFARLAFGSPWKGPRCPECGKRSKRDPDRVGYVCRHGHQTSTTRHRRLRKSEHP